MDDSSYETWKRVLVEVAKKEKRFIKEHGRPLWSWFEGRGKGVCSLNGSVCVDTDGSMYVCHACPHAKHKDMFRLGNTKDITNFEQCVNDGINDRKIEPKCQKCPAVVCHSCNIAMLDETIQTAEKYKDFWNNVVVNNEQRCRYYQYFSVVYHALRIKL